MVKCGSILGAFDIKYLLRITVKGQVLANLLAEFSEWAEKEVSKDYPRADREVMTIFVAPLPYWELYVDGTLNQKGLGVGIVMISPGWITIEKFLRLDFLATKNEAEYEALKAGLSSVKKFWGGGGIH